MATMLLCNLRPAVGMVLSLGKVLIFVVRLVAKLVFVLVKVGRAGNGVAVVENCILFVDVNDLIGTAIN